MTTAHKAANGTGVSMLELLRTRNPEVETTTEGRESAALGAVKKTSTAGRTEGDVFTKEPVTGDARAVASSGDPLRSRTGRNNTARRVKQGLARRLTQNAGKAAAAVAIGLMTLQGPAVVAQESLNPQNAIVQTVQAEQTQETRAANVQYVQSTAQVVRAAQEDGPGVYMVGNGPFRVGLPGGSTLELTREAVADFDAWLAANHPNWTLIVYPHADQAPPPTTINGRQVQGEEAEIYRILGNHPTFTGIEHAQTGQPEANFLTFVIDGPSNRPIDGRRISYWAGEVYDERGLGEKIDGRNNFTGNLDRPFIDAMRGGGQVWNGLRDLVSSIDAQLGAKLAQEQAAVDAIGSSVRDAGRSVTQLEGAMRDLKRSYPNLEGDLVAASTIAALTARVDGARTMFEAENYQGARSAVREVRSSIESLQFAISRYSRADAEVFQPIRADLARLAPMAAQYQAARPILDEAERMLGGALAQHQFGASTWGAEAAAAAAKVSEAESVIEAAITAEKRQTQILTGLAVALGLAILGAGVFFRRRRNVAKAEAEKLYEDVEKLVRATGLAIRELQAEMDALGVGGPLDAATAFSGRSTEFGVDLVKKLMELSSLRVEEDQALGVVNDLMNPKGVFARFSAAFSAGRYDEVKRMLTSASEIPAPEELKAHVVGDLDGDGVPEEARKILLSSFDEVMKMLEGKTWTIKDLDAQVQRVTKDLIANIEHLRKAVGQAETAHPALRTSAKEIDRDVRELFLKSIADETQRSRAEELLSQIDELTAQGGGDDPAIGFAREQLAQLAKEHSDGRFLTEAVSAAATPKARALADRGKQSADAKDVITAMEDSFNPAYRILGDSDRLVELTQELRDIMLPKVESTRRTIELPTAWVDRRIDELSKNAATLSDKVADEAVGEQIDALQLDRVKFRQQVTLVAQLDARRRTDSPVRIDKAQAAVDRARTQLVEALSPVADRGTLENKVLREKDHSTDTSLQTARAALDESVPHLTQGNVEKGDAALDVVDAQTALTHQIVERSLESAKTHQARLDKGRAERSDISDRLIPDRAAVLDTLKREYASNNWSGVKDAVANAREHLRLSEASEARAEARFQTAALIAAADNLSGFEAAIANSRETLDGIVELQARLQQQDRNNYEAIRSVQRGALAHLQRLADDHRTLGGSSARANDLEARVDRLQRRLDERGRDPVALRGELSGLETEIQSLQRVIESEHAAYDRASSMIRRAASWSTSESVSYSDRPDVSRAKRLLRQGLYSEAYRAAKSEYDDAERAESSARSARLAAEAAERAARRARERAAASSSSSFSSGSSSSSFSVGSGSSSSSW